MAPARSRLRNLAAVLGITTIVAAAAVTRHHYQMMEQHEPASYLTWPHAMIQEMPFFYLWALAVPLVLWFTRRVARLALHPAAVVSAHLGFAALVILAQGLLHTTAMQLLTPSEDPATLMGRLEAVLNGTFWRLPTQLVMYGAVLGTVLAYDYYRRLVHRELDDAAIAAELAEARLGALRAQLHPHFVFNALNSVAMLVRGQRNTEAVDTIAGLSDLLRDTLEDGQPEVSLRQELAFIERYLAIERIRFGDRLRVSLEAEPGVLDTRVPRLLLQPLVENAVRHGVSRRSSAGRIVIRAARAGEQLLLQVDDDGPGPDAPGHDGGHGVGLSNTRQRLATMYGRAASLRLEPGPLGGARASVTLPLTQGAAV